MIRGEGPLPPNPSTREGSDYNRLVVTYQYIILPSLVEGQGGGSFPLFPSQIHVLLVGRAIENDSHEA